MTRMNWDKAKRLDTREPVYKEKRLDRAADNWADHGTLNKSPKSPGRKKKKTGGDKFKSARPAGPCVSLVSGLVISPATSKNIKPQKKYRAPKEPKEQRRGKSKNKLPAVFHGVLENPHWVGGFRVLYLDVPYEEREEAKRLGAKWNPDRKRWWILAAGDRKPFKRWLPQGTPL